MASTERLDDLSPAKRALYEIRALKARVAEFERQHNEPIAITGAGLRFPGGASSLDSFWNLLMDRTDAVTEVPSSRWRLDRYYDPDPDAPGKMYARHGAFLADATGFDADFFSVSPREAMNLDPQHRVALEVAWEALENAGYSPLSLEGTAAGVFLALGNSDYGRLVFGQTSDINAYSSTGNLFSAAAGRISHLLGLQGPSLAIDTACSGSLVAVHLACNSLRSGECSVALAGGVNLMLSPEVHINFSKSRMMAADGKCKTFDAAADGYVRGEGCGFLVLKRLSQAVADRDHILAVIRGSAVNQDGRSGGLTVPNGVAQEALLQQALKSSGVQPQEIGYIEAHGTGTSLGDPIEARALVSVLGPGRTADNPLVLGSVKTNIGHLEAAAGVAGMIKSALALERGLIPAHLHFHQLNPHINWAGAPVEIPTEARAWPRGEKRRLAGVSSFGFSGTNAHVILEEAPLVEPSRIDSDRLLHILALSARSYAALAKLQELYQEELSRTQAETADFCYTANTGRAHFEFRMAITGRSNEELLRKLASAPKGSLARDRGSLRVTFLFPDIGMNYSGMARELYDTQPVFRAALDKCAELLKSELAEPLLDALWSGQPQYARPALFAVEYALTELWRSWGLEPSAVMGQGVGELVAACVAGVYSLSDGLKLAAGCDAATVQFQAPGIPMISSITGQVAEPQAITSAGYWRDQAAQPARIRDAMKTLRDEGYTAFVEIGPGTTLTTLGRECMAAEDLVWAASIENGRESETLLESLGRLYERGADVNWTAFDKPYARRRVPLPTYPFERQQFWLNSTPTISSPALDADAEWEQITKAETYQSRQGRLDLELGSYAERWSTLARLTSGYIVSVLQQFGLFTRADERHSPESIISQAGIGGSYTKLLHRWLKRLVAEGQLAEVGGAFFAPQPLQAPELESLKADAERVFRTDHVFLEYVVKCGDNLAAILTGKMSPLETLFPSGDFSFAEELYERAALSAYFSALGRTVLETLGRTRAGVALQILEVGAGTGSTASAMVEALAAGNSTYYLTDVSDFFLRHAERKFAKYPFVRYGILDVERGGPACGYAEGSMDVVVATNVIHATRDIRKAIANVKALLAPGGIFILCEVTNHLSWFDITTGLIEGWQLFEDDLRGDHPLLPPDTWSSLLTEAGFVSVAAYPEAGSPACVLGQNVFVARTDPGQARLSVKPAVTAGHTAHANGARAIEQTELPIWLGGTRAEVHEGLVELIRGHIAEILRYDSPERVDRARRLMDLGLDSLMALELRNRIAKSLGLERPLSSTLVFDYPTVDAVADHLQNDVLQLNAKAQADLSADAPEPPDAMSTRMLEIAEMDESEAEALLIKRLQSL